MSFRMAVIGAGRMGSIIASQLPLETKKIIVDTDYGKACRLAEKVKGVAAESLQQGDKTDMVAVVLPTPSVNVTVQALLNIVQQDTIILNMATTARIDPALLIKRDDISIVDAKIIGHAMSISAGEPAIIVVDCADEDRFDCIRKQFPGFHKVVKGEAALVETINKTGSMEGIRAAVRVRKTLSKLNLPDEWIDVAIRTVCAGTMRSYTENDLGHFALELARKLENEME